MLPFFNPWKPLRHPLCTILTPWGHPGRPGSGRIAKWGIGIGFPSILGRHRDRFSKCFWCSGMVCPFFVGAFLSHCCCRFGLRNQDPWGSQNTTTSDVHRCPWTQIHIYGYTVHESPMHIQRICMYPMDVHGNSKIIQRHPWTTSG